MEDNEKYWNDISNRYQELNTIRTDDFHYGPLLPGDNEMKLLPDIFSDMKCLEIGCGAGQNSIYLAKSGASCTALDLAENQLKKGQEIACKENVSVHFLHADMDRLPSLDKYHLIHSTYALPFSRDPERCIRACSEILLPGGIFLFTIGHPVYSGEWLDLEDGEEGMFISDYFKPHPDIRKENDAVECAHFYSIEETFNWIRNAGLLLTDLREPQPLPLSKIQYSPYISEAWKSNHSVFSRIPFVLIFKTVKQDNYSPPDQNTIPL